MDGQAGLLLEDAGEMKGRSACGACDVVERDAFRQPARKIGLGRLDAVWVIGVGAPAAAFTSRRPWVMSRERGFQHFRNKLKRRHIGPERIGPERLWRIGFGSL